MSLLERENKENKEKEPTARLSLPCTAAKVLRAVYTTRDA